MTDIDDRLASIRARWGVRGVQHYGMPKRDDVLWLIEEVERLRAASATRPVTLDYDNGYKQGFRDGLHQQGYDVDRLVAEAVAGSATPDCQHMIDPTRGTCAKCGLTDEYIRDARQWAGSATPTRDDDDPSA
jgi:hypothetical protein